ncbi:MAG: ABC transporter permease, partial [Limisphaerales bacterium]
MNWFLLKNSLLVGTAATLLAMGLGIAGALWVTCLSKRWRGVILSMAVIAAVLPPFLVTNCWLHFFGFTGVWKKWLPLDLFSLGGTIWVLSLLLWPIPLLAAWSAWQRLEPAQLETDMAVTGWSLIRGLLLPVARAALAQAGVLIFVLALNNFAVPSILQVKVSPAEMWIRFNTEFDTPGVLQLCWPLVILPLMLVAWFRRSGVPWPHRQLHAPARLVRQQLGPAWFWTSGSITLLVCFLSVGMPLLQLVTTPRTWTELPGALAAGQGACWNSFFLAALSATVVTAAGVTARRQSERAREGRLWSWVRTTVMAVLWLPFLLPGVLIGIGLIAVFNRPGLSFFYQSAGIVVLAFLVRYLGFGWTTLGQVTKTADPALSDAARLEGASRWQLFRFVQWPQLGSQIAAAWYVVFLLCLWDVESMIE